ncbi:glycosyl transferase [Aspergillus heterothallicus]
MRPFQQLLVLVLGVEALFIWLSPSRGSYPTALSPVRYPLLTKYFSSHTGDGGAWYIPPEWIRGLERVPTTIVEAAKIVRNYTQKPHIPHTVIPSVMHQTWKSANPVSWPEELRHNTEKWLQAVEDAPMAYFLWDDHGMAQFIQYFEPGLEYAIRALPSMVEQSDVFRILVSKWVGGIYSDMDTKPIRNPATWIESPDRAAWEDPETNTIYHSEDLVRAIVGLEAVCPSDSDLYWRMGYTYPVQLTQWSFAWAPDHPILQLFLDNLAATLQDISSKHDGNLRSLAAQRELSNMDALTLTGPAAFTVAVRRWLEATNRLRWNALSTNPDRSKLVGDVLVLPITGFSPGRGRYGNMGSKPTSDPSARLIHHGQGSWKKTSLLVEYGKFCRTFFGRCKDWSKVPHNILY